MPLFLPGPDPGSLTIILLQEGRVTKQGTPDEIMPELGLARKGVSGCSLTEPTRLHLTEIPTTC